MNTNARSTNNQKPMTMNRDRRASMAQETLAILQQGTYVTSSGSRVDIAQSLADAVQRTRLYRPADFAASLPLAPSTFKGDTKIEVTPETTLEAAQRLALSAPDDDALCLNFASAKNPGGGFLGGSQAQEESLARSSGLYLCLLSASEMYEYNRSLASCLYSDYMIYSPHVPVFRDDAGMLLEEPYFVSFLSVPAVNAGAVRRNEPQDRARIQPTMQARTAKLLWVAAQHQHRTLVLGAWGCGVFGNDPGMVAELFAGELRGTGLYADRFAQIIFAIYDRSADQETRNAFVQRFGTG